MWQSRGQISAAEIACGWQRVSDLAIIPAITDVGQSPTPGIDEWFVFERLAERARLAKFSSANAFEPFGESDKVYEFWSKIEDLQPTQVPLGTCTSLLLTTQDAAKYERVFACYLTSSRTL